MFVMFLKSFEIIQEIQSTLKIFYDTTNHLQKSDLTLSDGYGAWLICLLKLKDLKQKTNPTINLIDKFIIEMEKRKTKALDYKAMYAAVYLDPRYRRDLSSEKVQEAKAHLLNIWQNILEMRKLLAAERGGSDGTEISEDDLLQQYFDSHENTSSERRNHNRDNDFIITKLQQLEQEPQALKHNFSILVYWKQKQLTEAELYEMSRYVYTIPPTQCTVERAFSALKCIRNSKRCSLKQGMLEVILNINLNQQTAREICEEELKEIKQRHKQN